MAIDTKNVADRREVHYESLDDLLADAEQLAAGETNTMGNWTLGQIFKHLAQSIQSSIDGTDMKFPWVLKKIIPLFLKKRKLLNEPLRPGFKIPKSGQSQFVPDPNVSTEEGLDALREAVGRYQSESRRAEHAVFGALTSEEWTKLHLRHAEMHMSFAVPQ